MKNDLRETATVTFILLSTAALVAALSFGVTWSLAMLMFNN